MNCRSTGDNRDEFDEYRGDFEGNSGENLLEVFGSGEFFNSDVFDGTYVCSDALNCVIYILPIPKML